MPLVLKEVLIDITYIKSQLVLHLTRDSNHFIFHLHFSQPLIFGVVQTPGNNKIID